jgi:hypothetical protein
MIRVRSNSYSVPSQLKGEHVRVRIYEERIDVFYAGKQLLAVERLRGSGRHHVNYRHIIDTLVRKPGAFERYRYREDLFPSETFRQTYDVLCEALPQRKADIEYVRCLDLAAKTLQSDVETTLRAFLDAGRLPKADEIKEAVAPRQAEIPEMSRGDVDLEAYDALIDRAKEVS